MLNLCLSDDQYTWEERRRLGGMSLVLLFLATLPLLGAYVSHAKRRGIAEGFVLVAFFGPLDLIVALCLPTNRDHG
jgi:hypothetical protein